MKTKKIAKVDQKEFNNIYAKPTNVSKAAWKKIFADEIKLFDKVNFTSGFWYIGDFQVSKIVAVGGACEDSSPIKRSEWIGLEPMELGKLFHPLDMLKMQAYTVFVATHLSTLTDKQRNNLKVSMVFRMLNSKNQYTWRILHYPKMHYVNNRPQLIMCQIDDYHHLIPSGNCTMFILDKNLKDQTLFYCDDEKVKLKPYGIQKPLSGRELQVLKLLARGLISKEIADILKISKNTVENHKQNIYEKTGTKKATELVAMAANFLGE
jgi:DNA-binding CsgD family transcriptional regulator